MWVCERCKTNNEDDRYQCKKCKNFNGYASEIHVRWLDFLAMGSTVSRLFSLPLTELRRGFPL